MSDLFNIFMSILLNLCKSDNGSDITMNQKFDLYIATYWLATEMEDQNVMNHLSDQGFRIGQDKNFSGSMQSSTYDMYLDICADLGFVIEDYKVKSPLLDDMSVNDLINDLDISKEQAVALKNCTNLESANEILTVKEGFYGIECSKMVIDGYVSDNHLFELINNGHTYALTVVEYRGDLYISSWGDFQENLESIVYSYLNSLELVKIENENNDNITSFVNKTENYTVSFVMENGDPIKILKIDNEKALINEDYHYNEEFKNRMLSSSKDIEHKNDVQALYLSLDNYHADQLSI